MRSQPTLRGSESAAQGGWWRASWEPTPGRDIRSSSECLSQAGDPGGLPLSADAGGSAPLPP
eukprot:jgi/Mesen1/192/ME1137277C07604